MPRTLYQIKEKYFNALLYFIAVIIYLIASYNSHGYYHADEHYQIIEFAQVKLGINTVSEVAWEYNTLIRSSFQPWICIILFKIADILSIHDPYVIIFILRLLTAALSLYAIRSFSKSIFSLSQPYNLTAYLLLALFLWFLPVINIRFSSETWAGLFLILAFSKLNSYSANETQKYALTGTLLGISFLCRFQMLIILFIFIVWLSLIKKESFRHISTLLICFSLIAISGVALDSIFYNKFCLTAYNYYITAIESGGSGFGESPWYYYITAITKYAIFPIGVIILISIVIAFIKNPTDLIIWCIIAFIGIHSLIPHKEERFIFSLVNLIPYVLMLTYSNLVIKAIHSSYKVVRVVSLCILGLLFLLNTVGILFIAFKSAGIGRMEITRYIHQNYAGKPVKLIYLPWSSPTNPWNGTIYAKYYREKNIKECALNSFSEVNNALGLKDTINLLVIRRINLSDTSCFLNYKKTGNIKLIQSITPYYEKIEKIYDDKISDDILLLYKLNKH